jgi:hypothetical protein
MAKYRVTAPDGQAFEINAPDGASQDEVLAYAQQNFPKPEASVAGDLKQGAGNLAAGLVRGAGSIGATILAPYDMAKDAIAGKGLSLESNRQRRADMDAGLQTMGAEPDSMLYKGGKLGGEIAGTLGVGGALANGARAMGASAPVVSALATSGLRTGNAAAPLLSKAGAMNLATRAAGGAITGGVSAGMVNPEDAGTGAMIGGALPVSTAALGAAGRGMGRAVRGAPVAPEVRDLAMRAKDLGIDIPADRIANSKPMNALASSLNYVPFSGRAATEAKMSSQLNQALSRTFGQDSDNVTQALRKADDVLGGQFDDFLRSNTVRVDKKFVEDLAEAANQASRELGTDGASIISKQVDEIISKAATGEIDGQTAYNIKKTLDRIGNRNSPEAFYALDLKHKLMDVLNRSVGDEKAAAFSNLRQQYGNMLSLQKLAKNGAEGDISVARLANMRGIRNKNVQELADIAAQFVKEREGQHGAAQRAYGAMGAAAAGYFGGPATAIGGMAAGRAANGLLGSNLARDAILGIENPMITQNLGGLLQGGYRVAPLLSGQ